MKVLLHDGGEIIQVEALAGELPERIGPFVRSDRKADGMLVYYRFDLGEQLLSDEEERRK